MHADTREAAGWGGWSSRTLELALIAAAAVAYATILTTAKFNFFFPKEYGLVFNSMLDHVLRGRFDIDPAIVGNEGYVRDGLTYSYWGIFCAFLRLPLLLVPGGMRLDVTVLSCWLGASLAAAAKIHGLFWVRRNAEQTRHAGFLFLCLLACFMAGGPLVANLAPTIYSEPIFWAYALATMFVVTSVQGFVLGQFSTMRLCLIALLAGLCLLARSATGIGLYLALAVLLLARLLRDRSVGAPGLLLPALIALAAVGVTTIVNAGRWGSPFTGQDLAGYVMLHSEPQGVGVLARHGMFSASRIPLALQYYFLPLWPLRDSSGELVFAAAEQDLFYTVELPPSSLLLTDLLPFVLGVTLLGALLRGRIAFPRWTIFVFTSALLAPPGVVLLYWALTDRYRIEFAPALDAVALLAAAIPQVQHSLSATRLRRYLLLAATLVSVGATFITLVLYRLAFYGDVHRILQPSFKAFYESRYSNVARSLGLNLPFSRQR